MPCVIYYVCSRNIGTSKNATGFRQLIRKGYLLKPLPSLECLQIFSDEVPQMAPVIVKQAKHNIDSTFYEMMHCTFDHNLCSHNQGVV